MKLFYSAFRSVPIFCLLCAVNSYGAVIEFPDYELAPESVLPLFDKAVSVRDRRIVSRGRIEMGIFSGFSLLESFYSQYSVGVSSSYHFNEINALHASFFYWIPGLTEQAHSLRERHNIFLEKAPSPESYLTLEYQHSSFYGKMSISKNYVINTHIYGLLGGGVQLTGEATYPTFNFGLGQKLYFSKLLALRVDLRGVLYSGPNPLKGPAFGGESNKRRPPHRGSSNLSSEDFESQLIFSTLLSVGMVYRF